MQCWATRTLACRREHGALLSAQDFVRERFRGVDAVPNLSGTCLQTNVPDNNFVLDFVPGTDEKVINIIIIVVSHNARSPWWPHCILAGQKLNVEGKISACQTEGASSKQR